MIGLAVAALPKALAAMGVGVLLAVGEAGVSAEVVILALIAATPPTIVALVTLAISVLNTRAARDAKAAANIAATEAAAGATAAAAASTTATAAVTHVQELRVAIDGRMSRLLELTERASLAEGELAGLDKGVAAATETAAVLAAAVAAPAAGAAPTEVTVVQDEADPALRVKGDKPKS